MPFAPFHILASNFYERIKNFLEYGQTIRMTDKNCGHDDTMLKEGDCTVTDPNRVSNIFNEYFSRVAESVGKPDIIGADEPVAKVVNRHSEHPSVKAVKDKYTNPPQFKFDHVQKDDIVIEFNRSPPPKKTKKKQEAQGP